MSANLGLEAPGATPLLQNIILYPYVNPATEVLDSTGTAEQPRCDPHFLGCRWDPDLEDHPQRGGYAPDPLPPVRYSSLINRVAWDNIISPPDPNELGWKDTVRINPLQDTYVALRPIVPVLPFAVPDSKRPLNPMMPLGARGRSERCQRERGRVQQHRCQRQPPPPIVNDIVNFGWEYVWHCHILSHEEMDMMRPQSVFVPRELADAPVLSATGYSGAPINLTWTDGTPVTTFAGPTWGKPKAEIGYRIERAIGESGGTFEPVGTALANATSFTDNTTVLGTRYRYNVVAFNAAGDSISNTVLAALPPVVSGTLGANGAGATVNFTGGSTTAAAGTGNYSFSVLSGWTGTITPSKLGYIFSPTSINVTTPVTADLPNQDFTATLVTYTVSGTLGITGATVAFSGTTSGSATVVGSSYSFTAPTGWTGTITPSLTGYTFSPVSINVTTPVTANLPNQNFTATLNTYTVSGTLGTTGATVAFNGTTSGSATVVGSSYSFTAPHGWTGTITPSKTGYTFSPALITISAPGVTATLPNQNFTATLNTYTVSGTLGTTRAQRWPIAVPRAAPPRSSARATPSRCLTAGPARSRLPRRATPSRRSRSTSPPR